MAKTCPQCGEANAVTTAKEEAAGHGRNLKPVLKRGIKILKRGIEVGVVNAAAASASEVLNYYLETRGLNSKRVSVSITPNTDRGAPPGNPMHGRI